MPIKPLLVFAYGNPSRGDDALGPALLDMVATQLAASNPCIELLSDFQLQIEHALDVQDRVLVLFIDASVAGASPYGFTELGPAKDKSYTTHAMSPAAVLAVYQSITQQSPPPCFLLTIKGEAFELGAGLSAAAERHLAQAIIFVGQLLAEPTLETWRRLTNV